MLPLSAFLITRDSEHSAVQGEENSVFLLYSVADCILSSRGPQPRLDVSQQAVQKWSSFPTCGSRQVVAERWYF